MTTCSCDPASPSWHLSRPSSFLRDLLSSPQIESKTGVLAKKSQILTSISEIEPASQDIVISTLVLCSVEDQTAAIGEIYRVLKPGGMLLFLEHVAAGWIVLAPVLTALCALCTAPRLDPWPSPVLQWIKVTQLPTTSTNLTGKRQHTCGHSRL